MAASSSADLERARCVCGALRRATRAVSRHYDAYLIPAGMTIARYSLLTTLARLGTPTVTAYARDLAMDRTTVLRNLRPLIEEGLVSVEPAKTGRAHVARLTAKGRASLERARPVWRAAQRELAARVSGDDVERLLAVAAALSA